MTRWGFPEPGAAPAEGLPEGRRERRAVLLGRSAAGPLSLALSTVAGIAGAVLALLPAAVVRRPAGRFGPRGAGAPGGAVEPADPAVPR
ncbi:MAG TPA: hypothetical protein VF875_13705 [Anaeromyxobacter sp.]